MPDRDKAPEWLRPVISDDGELDGDHLPEGTGFGNGFLMELDGKVSIDAHLTPKQLRELADWLEGK
jgi:hypothetical protein